MRTMAALAAIIALGLGLRVAEAWDGRPPVYDAQAYAAIAANLEAGEGFTVGEEATQPSSNYSPGLPLFVAGLYGLSGGEHERFARVVLALVGTLAVLFAFLIGRRLSGDIAGLIGAGVVAVYPALLEYQGMIMGEPLAATLVAGAVLSILWAEGRGAPGARVHARYWVLPGLLLGALALVRPEYLAISALVAVVVAARRGLGGWRSCGVQAGVMLLGVVVVVAPWTVRNAAALDRFVPVSTGGGQVLFAGSYLPSGGDPERVGEKVLERHPGLRRELAHSESVPRGGTNPPRLERILAALAARRYPGVETDKALARMGREELWDDVSEQPVDYAGFLVAKVWRVWGHGPRDVMREPVWAVLHWLLVGFALVGLVALARQRRWEALLLGVALLAVTATGALLVASPRRLLVTVPLLAALAGAGATWLGARIRH